MLGFTELVKSATQLRFIPAALDYSTLFLQEQANDVSKFTVAENTGSLRSGTFGAGNHRGGESQDRSPACKSFAAGLTLAWRLAEVGKLEELPAMAKAAQNTDHEAAICTVCRGMEKKATKLEAMN